MRKGFELDCKDAIYAEHIGMALTDNIFHCFSKPTTCTMQDVNHICHLYCTPIIHPLCGTRTQEIFDLKKTLSLIHAAIMFPLNVLLQQISTNIISRRQG